MSSGGQSRQWLWQGKSFSFKKLETTLALSRNYVWGEKLKMSTLVLNVSDFQQTSLRDIWNPTVSHLVCRGRWRLQALHWWIVSVGGRGSASGGGGGAVGAVLAKRWPRRQRFSSQLLILLRIPAAPPALIPAAPSTPLQKSAARCSLCTPSRLRLTADGNLALIAFTLANPSALNTPHHKLT